MSLNDSINLLVDKERTSNRGLIRIKPNQGDKSNVKIYSDNRTSAAQKSIIINDTIQYVPNDVYMADRAFSGGFDVTLSGSSNTPTPYVKLDANLIKQKTDRLYEHFLEVAQSRTNDTEVFDIVQDLIQVCNETFDEIVRNGGRLHEKNLFSGFGWLNQERNTWKLLHCLYKDRLLNQQAMDGVSDDLWLHSSEKEIIDKLYEQNENLREYQLIVDWLEQCESQQHFDKFRHFMDDTISWENTLHQLQHNDRTVFGGNKAIVKSLDPDAPNRENLPLHDLDTEDEERISKEILFEIRQGRLDEAGALCERVGQYWRAAILEGWRLHHDPNYKNLGVTSEKYPIEGNPRRDLWKKLAWQMAENSKLNEYTRAYVGVFCGHLDALKGPLSSSWFDLFWAYLKVQIDIRVESELRSTSSKSYMDMPLKYWDNKMTLEEIFDELSARDNIRDVAEHQMTIIRKYLILDDIPELMRKIDSWLDNLKDDGQMLRFITHIVLFMRQIDRPHPEDIANKVINAYVEYLINVSSEASLVAYYTAALPAKHQVDLYATFLEQISETAARRDALDEAHNNGLDVNTITDYTVHSIRLKQSPIDDGKELVGAISALDEEKISALEWLTFSPNQCGELLWHANALIRNFLGENKVEAVRKAFKIIPQTIAQQIYTSYGSKDNLPAKVECSISEYICHLTYLGALDSYNDWLRLYHSKPKEPELVGANAHFTERMASEHKQQAYMAELERWKLNLMEQTEVTKSSMNNVLTLPDKGYLIDPDTVHPFMDEDALAIENRLKQLQGLRKLCIPKIVLLLHYVLHSAGDYKGAVKIAEELVSENWQLYAVYSKQQLAEIIVKVAESSIELIKEKKDPWGYSAST